MLLMLKLSWLKIAVSDIIFFIRVYQSLHLWTFYSPNNRGTNTTMRKQFLPTSNFIGLVLRATESKFKDESYRYIMCVYGGSAPR